MERKNTVLLTVIAIATLLVAVVGATFAYFTATTGQGGSVDGSNADINTAKLANVTFTQSGLGSTNHTIYPGTMNAVGASVLTKVDGTGVTNTYDISYTVKASIKLFNGEDSPEEFKHPIKWRLYKVDTNETISDVITCTNNPKIEQSGLETQYSSDCQENIEKLPTEKLVADGVINASGDCSPDSGQDNKNQKACGETAEIEYNDTIQASSSEKNVYYYLVVEYVNNGSGEQNDDMGKKMKIAIDSIDVTSTKDSSAS